MSENEKEGKAIEYLNEEMRRRVLQIRKSFMLSQSSYKELHTQEQLWLTLSILEKRSDQRNLNDLKVLEECTKDIKFFKELRANEEGEKVHRECCKYIYYVYIKAGTQIFREGLRGDTFYIILDGNHSAQHSNLHEHEEQGMCSKKRRARRSNVQEESALGEHRRHLR